MPLKLVKQGRQAFEFRIQFGNTDHPAGKTRHAFAEFHLRIWSVLRNVHLERKPFYKRPEEDAHHFVSDTINAVHRVTFFEAIALLVHESAHGIGNLFGMAVFEYVLNFVVYFLEVNDFKLGHEI